MQRFRGGLVFKAHRLCVSLNSRLESNDEEEEVARCGQHRVRKGEGGALGRTRGQIHNNLRPKKLEGVVPL